MIVTPNTTKHINWARLLAMLVMTLFLGGCQEEPEFSFEEGLSYDAEGTIVIGDRILPEKKDLVFKGKVAKSTEHFHSGKHSIEVRKGFRQYALTVHDTAAKAGDIYEVSVWRYSPNGGNGVIVASHPGGGTFYNGFSKPEKTLDNGWEFIRGTVFVPPDFEESKVGFYLWNRDTVAVFFDDFKVKKIKKIVYPTFDGVAALNLEIKEKEMAKLLNKRLKAFQNDILLRSENDFVRGQIIDSTNRNIKLRLKGDYLDHLMGSKWSFRIKTKKEQPWRGLSTFSIQSPETRTFLSEWVFHRLLKSQQVLTTKYEFAPVVINGRGLGLYAIEEHFTAELLVRNNRPVAPILKFNEDGIWERHRLEEKHGFRPTVSMVKGAEIAPFQASSVLEDPVQREQFIKGQNLLHSFRYATKPFSELFNVDAAARFYAVFTLTGAFHGLNWHNMRFYFDPTTEKLELIGYDGHASNDSPEKMKSVLGFETRDTLKIERHDLILTLSAFNDSTFVNKYIYYVGLVSDSAFIDAFFAENKTQMEQYEGYIAQEFPHYRYNWNFLYERAAAMRTDLNSWKDHLKNHPLAYHALVLKEEHVTCDSVLVEGLSLRAFTQTEDSASGNVSLLIQNFHCLPLEVIGTGPEKAHITHFLEAPFPLAKLDLKDPHLDRRMNAKRDDRFVFYRIAGTNKIYPEAIIPWPRAEIID